MEKVDSALTVLLSVIAIKPVLKKHLKSPWLFFILRAMLKAGKLCKKTRWAGRRDGEAAYVKSVLIMSALYLNLRKLFTKGKALEIMKQVILQLSHAVDYATARKHLLFTIRNPFERWLKYRTILITGGFGLYNDVEDVYIHRNRMHYIVRRCIFHDTFVEAGTPELTAFICDYDQSYHSAMFPEFYFDRNGAWENTIGHGAGLCHYVWKDKQILTEEFRQFLEQQAKPGSLEAAGSGDERRNQIRRQFDRRQFERRRFDRRQNEQRKA